MATALTTDGQFVIWANGQGLTVSTDQLNQLRVLLAEHS